MKGIRILVVEDNAAVRQLLKVLLEGEGYEIVEAADGLEGLAQAEVDRPDLMIVDLMMPELSGERMIAQLLQREDLAGVPILVVSGKFEALDRMASFLGEENVFPKPFQPLRLLDRVGELVGYPDEASA